MTITVGVYLGKKDRFLRNWYDILPRGQFPLLVKYCIQSYLKGVYFPLDTICDRDSFKERLRTLKELSPTQRNVTFTQEDGPIFKWVGSVDNGYRSEEIKSILKDTIIHTMLDEGDRTPLSRQQERLRYRGYWGEEQQRDSVLGDQRERILPRYEPLWEEQKAETSQEGKRWASPNVAKEIRPHYNG
ncbi:hypothetical protein GXN76_15875 [Kroppenstedtia pulmonis]|uniref:Uncharacterized protein n=1 Tax=Kroppenstedtia pulmonis TaxID=1380685 RepID=A0A7D3Y6V9_9BACL|nr:hypothetical protein [Kroppenstedtia pulmonis]QKG85785.1 hypothetical protein GXN76_15875 [Kroppenstedtia pulmonis]